MSALNTETRGTAPEMHKATYLGVETGAGSAEEALAVIKLYGGGNVGEELDRLGSGPLEGLGNDGGVDALVEHLLSGTEKASGNDDDRSGTVTGLDILSLGELDEHAGGGVHDGHVLEDGGTVVGDDDLTVGGLDHLVHALGAERGTNSIADRLGSREVGAADLVRLVGVLESILLGCGTTARCYGTSGSRHGMVIEGGWMGSLRVMMKEVGVGWIDKRPGAGERKGRSLLCLVAACALCAHTVRSVLRQTKGARMGSSRVLQFSRARSA